MKLHACLVTVLVACAGDPLPPPNAANDPSNPRASESPFVAPVDALSSSASPTGSAPPPPPPHDMQHMNMDGGTMNMPMPGGR